MNFAKYHGTGNDFIIADNMKHRLNLSGSEIAELCDRHKGIGGDGLILAESSEKADIFMNYYNADGSIAEMCGNGVRCLTAYAIDSGILKDKQTIRVETRAGIVTVDVLKGEAGCFLLKVAMGKPNFKAAAIPVITERDEPVDGIIKYKDRMFRYGCASMGNPHMLIVVDDFEVFPFAEIGAYFEKHPMFPRKANVSFAQVLANDEIRMDTWERGVGRTLACGSGTCAAVAVLNRMGLVVNRVRAHLSGGDLEIEVTDCGITMTGEAVRVFTGEFVKLDFYNLEVNH